MREPPKRTAEEIAEEIATTADAKQAALAESAKLYESEEGETVKPHWPGMFRFAEQLVSESDMEGKDYILQMLAYGRQLSDSDDRMNEKFKEQFQRWGRKERPLAENPIPPAIMPTYTPRSFNELLAYIHKFNGGERRAAMVSAMMMQNLCRSLFDDPTRDFSEGGQE